MANGLKSQGTELFFVDTVSASTPALVKMACPTGVSGLGGPADQIEDTCLDNTTDRTYVRGLGNPGQVTVPFILNPTQTSHQLLFTLKDAGEDLDWLVCLSESSTDPTLMGDDMVAPADRSSLAFVGYIADVNIDIATNDIVRGTLILQRSGSVTPTWFE